MISAPWEATNVYHFLHEPLTNVAKHIEKPFLCQARTKIRIGPNRSDPPRGVLDSEIPVCALCICPAFAHLRQSSIDFDEKFGYFQKVS